MHTDHDCNHDIASSGAFDMSGGHIYTCTYKDSKCQSVNIFFALVHIHSRERTSCSKYKLLIISGLLLYATLIHNSRGCSSKYLCRYLHDDSHQSPVSLFPNLIPTIIPNPKPPNPEAKKQRKNQTYPFQHDNPIHPSTYPMSKRCAGKFILAPTEKR